MGLRAEEAWERNDADEDLFRVELGLGLGDTDTRDATLARDARVITVFLTGVESTVSGSVGASELAMLSRSSSSWTGPASLRMLF